jgi:hypothetical protein
MTKSAEWAARLEAWRASGKNVNDFCAEHGYSAKNLVWWSSHFRRKAAPTDKRQRVILARVIRKPREVRPTPAGVVVQIGDARVEVTAEADRAAQAMVFEMLTAARGRAR